MSFDSVCMWVSCVSALICEDDKKTARTCVVVVVLSLCGCGCVRLMGMFSHPTMQLRVGGHQGGSVQGIPVVVLSSVQCPPTQWFSSDHPLCSGELFVLSTFFSLWLLRKRGDVLVACGVRLHTD